jgi:hypothetical protein
LHLAILNNNVELFNLLIENNVDIHIRDKVFILCLILIHRYSCLFLIKNNKRKKINNNISIKNHKNNYN